MNKSFIHKVKILLGLSLLVSTPLFAQQIIYPSTQEEQASRFEDLIEILDTLMQKTQADFGDYELVPSEKSMTESRLLHEVRSGKKLDVIWSSTSPQKEKALRAIRIPLRKGLLGYRLCFIHQENQSKFDHVNSLEDLKAYHIGQGVGWGDVALYQHSDIKVEQAPYQSLFKMISLKRFDLFPRGINEIFNELTIYGPANPNMAIENGFILYYPWPYYFFTSKENEALAIRIEAGLERMIEDGSFEHIFMKYHQDSIEQAQLDKRNLIRLENPILPKNTPLDNPKLWYFPNNI